ncbi:MAG: hypothetical protein M1828_005880 [Chrysothrix sp. TS-e1954]|nr:MAG: hypothetical protein M1828_005880 [Chrysothrix sp. TS-e1954]
MPKPRVIYWFRTDLRLHDSPALAAALDLSPEVLYPIWTFDPHYVYRARVGPNRFQFLLDCQNNLSENLTKLNKKQKLFLVREAPQTVLPKLWKKWRITHLVFEKDVDGYARQRDEEVMKKAKEAGVEVVTRTGRTLYDPDELVKANGGHPTMSMGQVQKAGEKLTIPRPIPAPKTLPDPGDTSLSDVDASPPPSDPDFNASHRDQDDKTYTALAGPDGTFSVPTLEELGMKPATTPHRGGEDRALASLKSTTDNETYTATFAKPNTAPTDFNPPGTTVLSPHMHFGSLSVRKFYWDAVDIVESYKKKHSDATSPPTSLTGQLLFRDMYFGAQAALGSKFAQTISNPTVRFVPWHLPSKISPSTHLITGAYEVDSPQAETWYKRWKFGRTGFPFIDAIMRQLRQEGWIHHLARHSVACFLTRGGCYVDWERGAEVFEEWLIDHETACNSGNWQWLSCTAFFAQFYRCYSPVAFGQKWDKDGSYIRRYVPELAKFDRKYIYEPWRAPIPDQKKWGCLIQGDGGAEAGTLESEQGHEAGVYPKPMLDFPSRRETCIQGLKKAYSVGLRGADRRVLDGTWRELFEDGAEGPTEGIEGPMGAMIEEDDGSGALHGEEDGDGNGNGDGGGGGEKSESPKKGGKRKASQGKIDGHVTKGRKK